MKSLDVKNNSFQKQYRLTDKQMVFVKAYSINQNAAKSAIIAGYPQKNSNVYGYDVLHKGHVIAAIKEWCIINNINIPYLPNNNDDKQKKKRQQRSKTPYYRQYNKYYKKNRYNNDENFRNKILEKEKQRWNDPEFRDKKKAYTNKPEVREKNREIARRISKKNVSNLSDYYIICRLGLRIKDKQEITEFLKQNDSPITLDELIEQKRKQLQETRRELDGKSYR